ncbi:MAG: PAS domain S-box protein, partial [Microcoleus sp. C1-bin4]|nr:PAS domain S-box protein [Microcoleus sp. C1-bin4]
LAAVTAVISLWAVASLIPWVPQMLALAGAASLPANTALVTQKVDRPQASLAIKNSGSSPTTEIQQINQQLLSEIMQRQRVEDILLDTVDKLQESQERFRVFQELSLDGFNVLRCIRDESKIVDFEWEYVNPAAAKILHITPEALVGKRLLEVRPGHKDNSLFDRFVQVVETGIPLDIESYYNSEGIVGWFRIMTVKLGDGIAISFSDITGRKQVEASLRNALQKLTSHFENTPLAVIEWDENFRLSGWSPAAQKIFGWKATEVLGKHFSEDNFISKGDLSEVESAIYSLKNPDHRCNVVRYSNYNKWGSLVHCEWYNSAFYSDSGQLISVLSLVLDVTERFKFLEVLRQSEERFRIAAESASDLIYEWDIETGIVLWFGHVDEHLEYEKGGFPRTREAWNSILHPLDRDRVQASVDRYLSAPHTWATPFFQEYRVQRQGGGLLHWIDRGKAVLDKQGNPCRWIGVISDISDRKQ